MLIKTKLYIQASKFSFNDKFETCVNTFKLRSDQSIVVVDIDEKEIEINCPEFTQEQFKNGHVEQLIKIKKDLLSETHLKAKSIDEQIESLLAIENKVL